MTAAAAERVLAGPAALIIRGMEKFEGVQNFGQGQIVNVSKRRSVRGQSAAGQSANAYLLSHVMAQAALTGQIMGVPCGQAT